MLANLFSYYSNIYHVSNKGLLYWPLNYNCTYIALPTNGILIAATIACMYVLIAATIVCMYTKLYITLDLHLAYTACTGPVLYFLNYRTIQIEHEAPINWYNYIHQTLVASFYESFS